LTFANAPKRRRIITGIIVVIIMIIIIIITRRGWSRSGVEHCAEDKILASSSVNNESAIGAGLVDLAASRRSKKLDRMSSRNEALDFRASSSSRTLARE
jgi:hypothetical protein